MQPAHNLVHHRIRITILAISLGLLIWWICLRNTPFLGEHKAAVAPPPAVVRTPLGPLHPLVSPPPPQEGAQHQPASNAFEPTNFYGRIDVKRLNSVPSWVAELAPDWNAMFDNDGLFDSEILKSYGLDTQRARELGRFIDSSISEIRSLELTNSRLVTTAEEEFIHVDPFFSRSAPIVEKVKEAVLENFSVFNDDRGFVFLSKLAMAPEFSDNGVLGKDIAFDQEYTLDGNLVLSFSIQPSGPPQALPPYPLFSSGTHRNVLAQKRYAHLFEHYFDSSSLSK